MILHLMEIDKQLTLTKLVEFTINGNRQTTNLNKTMLNLQLMEIDKLP